MPRILTTTALGLEELLADEVKQLTGTEQIKMKPGQVSFTGGLQDAYRLCLWSRLANRVLWQITEAKVTTVDELYYMAFDVDWSEHFKVTQTFAVDFFGTNRLIKNTQFGAVKVKDGIVDNFQREFQKRPDVDKRDPDLRIQVRLQRDVATCYLDLSGHSLHQRHYREDKGQAPIRENLAYAMLVRSGWTKSPELPLCDPMCGSGTIAIEAAMFKANIAPGSAHQHWGFGSWVQHDSGLWERLLTEAKDAQTQPATAIYASDVNPRMIAIAKTNAQNAGVAEQIQFTVKPAQKIDLTSVTPGFMVSNPPYGERLGELTSLIPLYQEWGHHLKTHFADWQLALLTSNRDLLRQLRLVSDKAYKFKNANLDCELALYKMDERNCLVMEVQNDANHDFANRLKKNLKRLDKWAKNNDIECYRLYDADLPEYNVAVDRYADWLVVQEYAAPKNIPQSKTTRRLHEVMACLPELTGVDASKIQLKVREVKKGKSQYEKVGRKQQFMTVQEHGLTFQVNLHDYLDTGLFLDHRLIRQRIMQMSKDKTVLNLFAYTGAVSVYAAKGGAKSVTTVDMSNTYLEWAKKNFALNQLRYGYHFIKADCTEWLHQHNEKYDVIFIDPPSFSNSKSMTGTWDVQRDYKKLLKDARKCLNPDGIIIFSNNLRSFKLDENIAEELNVEVENITSDTIPEDFKRNQKIHHCWMLRAK
ncbi:MAG: bifunctional 23S rRNA (guanine(2069)-N(7))-methyltransferase RlmK/23S rRNA (guanine(2445)-N(2))-methyltransferase RlmL [Aestuariibacter sp.]